MSDCHGVYTFPFQLCKEAEQPTEPRRRRFDGATSDSDQGSGIG